MKIFTCNKTTKITHGAIKVEVIGETIKFTQYGDRKDVKEVTQEDGSVTFEPAPFDINTVPPEDITVSVFDLSVAKQSSQSDSGCSWNIYASKNFNEIKFWYVNAHAVTAPTRGNAIDAFHLGKQDVPFAVLAMPRKDAVMTDCYLGINNGDVETHIFIEGVEAQTSPLADGSDLSVVRAFATPNMSIAVSPTCGPDALVNVELTVSTPDGVTDSKFNDPVYFETTGGHLAMNRVNAVAGVAKTRLRAADLLAGDVVTVKAGTKFFTSLAKADVQVVA